MVWVVLALFAFSCGGPAAEHQDDEPATKEADLKESLIKANRYLIRSEEEDIDDFLRRYGWKMQKTGTGLRYSIETPGKGDKARYGQLVTLKYKVMLLTGDVIYDSEQLGLKQFVVGRGGVETGLEEGIVMLRKGDKAKFILPSHLAFGLLGDSEKIPPRTPIVYLIEVVDIQ
ncbi:MAG: FKBP-type peptidyl-prolyl cis-trans isomerase [Bacteroidetes bacterium]|nr:FKBP-type peptidyl-prolyl cis-trans isomerase [Bacteroidota bacterium]